jgi:hypothetical protein
MPSTQRSGGDDDLTIDEAALFLRVEPSDVEDAVMSGVLPCRYRHGAPVLSMIELIQTLGRPHPDRDGCRDDQR